ncbi:MAG: hypothetical protein AAF208_12740 [Cyanobacteria bacterium P01_A01_bin.45]
MFPRQTLQQFIANALMHQDSLATGTSVMIKMYSVSIKIFKLKVNLLLITQ